MPALWFILAACAAAVLLSLMALLSALESALLNARRSRLVQLVSTSRHESLERLLESPTDFQTSAHLTKSLCESLLYAAAALLGMGLALQRLPAVPADIPSLVLSSWAGILGGAFAAFLAVTLFGEALPKAHVLRNPEAMLIRHSGFIYAFTALTIPLRRMTGRLARLLAFGTDPELTQRAAHSEEEIKLLVQGSAEEGVLEQEEKAMIHSIFEFTDTTARQVMTPRIDITGVSSTRTVLDAVRLCIDSGHSRLPVFDETLDQIVGVVHIKDLLDCLIENRPSRPVVDKMRKPFFIPGSKMIDELLRDFRRTKTQMAIVTDDHGGVDGLVTVEDVLEEIVGEIQDEYDSDEEVPHFQPADERGGALVDARLPVDDVAEALGVNIPEGDYDTFGGFVFSLFGHSPSEGESVEWNGLRIVADDLDGLRLRKVRVILIDSPQHEPANQEEAAAPGS